jgi:hypothetical protein
VGSEAGIVKMENGLLDVSVVVLIVVVVVVGVLLVNIIAEVVVLPRDVSVCTYEGNTGV